MALESLVLTYVVIILRFSVLTSSKNTTASPEYGSLDHSLLNCNNLNTYFFDLYRNGGGGGGVNGV